MSFLVIEVILITVSIILAKKMVANKTGFAKRLVIGKDSDANIEKMKHFAERQLAREITDPALDGMTINLEIKNGKIVKAEIESSKTKVTSSDENGTNVSNQGWSQKGAVAFTAFALWGMALWLHIIIALAVECIMLSRIFPQ